MKIRRVDWIGNLPLMDANEAKRKERKEVGAEWVDQSFVNTKLRSCRFTCDYHQSPLDVFNKLRRVDAALFFSFNFRKKRKSSDAFSVPSTCNGVFIISSLPFASKRLEKKGGKKWKRKDDRRTGWRKEGNCHFLLINRKRRERCLLCNRRRQGPWK